MFAKQDGGLMLIAMNANCFCTNASAGPECLRVIHFPSTLSTGPLPGWRAHNEADRYLSCVHCVCELDTKFDYDTHINSLLYCNVYLHGDRYKIGLHIAWTTICATTFIAYANFPFPIHSYLHIYLFSSPWRRRYMQKCWSCINIQQGENRVCDFLHYFSWSLVQ